MDYVILALVALAGVILGVIFINLLIWLLCGKKKQQPQPKQAGQKRSYEYWLALEKENLRKTVLDIAALFAREPPTPQALKSFRDTLLGMGPPLGYAPAWLGGWMCLGLSDIAYDALHRLEYQRILATAVAVERYRRVTGQLPERLEKLMPDYLTGVPLSQLDGEPLFYERKVNGFSITGSKYYFRRHFSLAWGNKQTKFAVNLTKQEGTDE